jgi:hypothetical protein
LVTQASIPQHIRSLASRVALIATGAGLVAFVYVSLATGQTKPAVTSSGGCPDSSSTFLAALVSRLTAIADWVRLAFSCITRLSGAINAIWA